MFPGLNWALRISESIVMRTTKSSEFQLNFWFIGLHMSYDSPWYKNRVGLRVTTRWRLSDHAACQRLLKHSDSVLISSSYACSVSRFDSYTCGCTVLSTSSKWWRKFWWFGSPVHDMRSVTVVRGPWYVVGGPRRQEQVPLGAFYTNRCNPIAKYWRIPSLHVPGSKYGDEIRLRWIGLRHSDIAD